MISCASDLIYSAPAALAEKAHESRSDRYAHVNTTDIIEVLESDGWKLTRADQARTIKSERRQHARHSLRFRPVDTPAVANVGDVFPEVVLKNSSDGSSAIELTAGLFRLVCSNGMVVGENTAEALRVRHVGDNVFDQVVTYASQIRSRMGEVCDVVQRWNQIKVSDADAIEFARAAAALRFPDAKIIDSGAHLPRRWDDVNDDSPEVVVSVDGILRRNRWADQFDDIWTRFNVVQENLIRGGRSKYRRLETARLERNEDGSPRRYRNQHARVVTSIDEDHRLNRELWDLAGQLEVALN